jgi:response regulator RpfG family c-di-GMP phosphodiesterase
MSQKEFDLLVVDDDPGILQLLSETFTEHSLTVQTAAGIGEARTQLAHNAFRIVVSDHNLPDGNGVDFLTEMRGQGLRSVPILMTGQTDISVAVEAINRGKVYQFVTKPLDLAALTHTVHRALQHVANVREQERLTREIIEHNERLRREAEAKERSLAQAVDKIRAEEETVERQKAHIESLYAEIQEAYLHTVTSLTAAIEAKDRYTRGHGERVYYYCSLMADVLSLSESSRRDLKFASVLHDLGKIGIPDSILRKAGRLTPDEKSTMNSHPVLTEEILRPLPFLESVRKIIREHHERCDGSGYPDGLTADQISLEGRMLAVADSYDAMRSDRAYRMALPREQAAAELQAGVGSQFCPLCVGALICALNTHGDFVAEDGTTEHDAAWEEEFLRLHPASRSVRVNTLSN